MRSAPISAITGLGFSRLSRQPIGTPRALALEAMRAAVMDSGVAPVEIDGLLLNKSAQVAGDAVPLKLQQDFGLANLRLLSSIDAKGASAIQMLQMASLAIQHDMASSVLCVFSDAPVGAQRDSGSSYVNASALTGIGGWDEQYGLVGAVANYAMAARRYLSRYGAEERHLGAYVLTCRDWASRNPMSMQPAPLTLEEYLRSRAIVDPFRVLDCAYPINGAAAFLVTSVERACNGARPPVYVHGLGQAHGGLRQWEPGVDTESTGALSAKAAFTMAGIAPSAVTCCQVYDSFSFCALLALEDFGVCGPGDAAGFVLDGNTAPGGNLPTNTGGGHLAGYYLQGMTPIAEAVIQARGDGGERQVAANDVIAANGTGGLFEHHATAVLSPHSRLS
jgi:acetyl-CoA acetyltransferase